MSVSVEQVKKLNEQIKKLNDKRNVVAGKIQMMQTRLNDELARYKAEFGLDLGGENIRETVANILAEEKKVSSAIEEEFAFKSKVVAAIESGNIDEANRLLGIKDEVETKAESVATEDKVADEVEPESDTEGVDDSENFDLGDFGDVEVSDTGDLEDDGDSFKVEDNEVEDTEDDDDEDFDDFGFGDLLTGTKFGN